MTTTIQRIDRLSNERARLYSIALNARRGDRELTQRIKEITSELDQLWDLRRRERVGQLDGIDLIVEQSYAKTYGEDFRETVEAPAVEEEGQAIALVA